ncbi:hypothetical protein CDD80_4607 [Ophiocordyceps camponoti-rufipedis]|uniref:Uncharacterized protein n=1 Tax=Ophiocordyceps camponoti-rufipedis TaxID=2004952 RepID=A0A2C5YU72_9HYPO|nr:hypothetical protein CDD80_4607 [Ophiocordyceps camponoti-rufipedis]
MNRAFPIPTRLSSAWRISELAASLNRPCLQPFSTTAVPLAGHNKWSKIKHAKAASDLKKGADRGTLTKLISAMSRNCGGSSNDTDLQKAIATAVKAHVPKNLIEAAVARGQRKTVTGEHLHPITFEILIRPNTAIIVDVETERKLHTMQELTKIVKKHDGVVTSVQYNFQRLGRLVLTAKSESLKLDRVMDEAFPLDAIVDVQEPEDGTFVVMVEPSGINAAGSKLTKSLQMEVVESEIVWMPKDDSVSAIESRKEAENVASLVQGLRECPEVRAVFTNVSRGTELGDEEWDKVANKLDTFHGCV